VTTGQETATADSAEMPLEITVVCGRADFAPTLVVASDEAGTAVLASAMSAGCDLGPATSVRYPVSQGMNRAFPI